MSSELKIGLEELNHVYFKFHLIGQVEDVVKQVEVVLRRELIQTLIEYGLLKGVLVKVEVLRESLVELDESRTSEREHPVQIVISYLHQLFLPLPLHD